jgi:hypothetical protein
LRLQVGAESENCRAILEILQALRQLTQPAEAPKRRRIGFVQD